MYLFACDFGCVLVGIVGCLLAGWFAYVASLRPWDRGFGALLMSWCI